MGRKRTPHGGKWARSQSTSERRAERYGFPPASDEAEVSTGRYGGPTQPILSVYLSRLSLIPVSLLLLLEGVYFHGHRVRGLE